MPTKQIYCINDRVGALPIQAGQVYYVSLQVSVPRGKANTLLHHNCANIWLFLWQMLERLKIIINTHRSLTVWYFIEAEHQHRSLTVWYFIEGSTHIGLWLFEREHPHQSLTVWRGAPTSVFGCLNGSTHIGLWLFEGEHPHRSLTVWRGAPTSVFDCLILYRGEHPHRSLTV